MTCTTVLPGYTRTRYFERIGDAPDIPDKYWMTADEVARVAFDGARRHLPLVIPGAVNRRAIMLATAFPTSTKGRVVRQMQHARHMAARAKSRLLK